jgi:hypothetical protein
MVGDSFLRGEKLACSTFPFFPNTNESPTTSFHFMESYCMLAFQVVKAEVHLEQYHSIVREI